MAKTFTNSEKFLAYMQERYGSANFSKWQQIRTQFYSYQLYPLLGATQFNFFGFGLNGSGVQGRQFTNMPKANSFGQVHFLLKQIRCKLLLLNAQLPVAGAVTDATNPAAEITHGFAQAGVLNLTIGDKKYLELPRPFLYAPPADGQTEVSASNTVVAASTPRATLTHRRDGGYLVDPNILIEAEQAFDLQINYPSGAVPIIATTAWDQTEGTQLAIGVSFDGILFRPVQ